MRKLRVGGLIFLNPNFLILILGHATHTPVLDWILESSVEWHYHCFRSSGQKGTENCSSILLPTLVLEGFGRFCSDPLTKWLLVKELQKLQSGLNFHETVSASPFPALSKEGDPCCLPRTLALNYWWLQNWKRNAVRMYRLWPEKTPGRIIHTKW